MPYRKPDVADMGLTISLDKEERKIDNSIIQIATSENDSSIPSLPICSVAVKFE